MKIIHVSQASMHQIDYLVAKCEGWSWQTRSTSWYGTDPWWEKIEGDEISRHAWWELAYSSNPSIGQPILERERISTYPHPDDVNWIANKENLSYYMDAPTMLIAGLRTFIASKIGETAEVPDDL